jgi:hypothetical protein
LNAGLLTELDVEANMLWQGLEGLFQSCKWTLDAMAPTVSLKAILLKRSAVSYALGNVALAPIGFVERH